MAQVSVSPQCVLGGCQLLSIGLCEVGSARLDSVSMQLTKNGCAEF